MCRNLVLNHSNVLEAFFIELGLVHIACHYYKLVLSTDPDNLRHNSNREVGMCSWIYL